MITPPPRVSVVIATKNRSTYLRQALQSLINQTTQDLEVIIVDDHSNEAIAEVVAEFADSRLIYIQNTGTGGISASRNLGNAAASAPWIAVLDSDDLAFPRRLERSLQVVEADSNIDIVYSHAYQFHDGSYDFSIWKRTVPYDPILLYQKNFIVHSTAMYRRDLVLSIGYDESLPSAVDYDLWLSLADRGARFSFIEETLVAYRYHENQIVNTPEDQVRQDSQAQKVREKHKTYQTRL